MSSVIVLTNEINVGVVERLVNDTSSIITRRQCVVAVSYLEVIMAAIESELIGSPIPVNNPTVDLDGGIKFELSPIQEEWLTGAQPNCLSCITVLCVCCSTPKLPMCPSGCNVSDGE
jgi:hypothetical protein